MPPAKEPLGARSRMPWASYITSPANEPLRARTRARGAPAGPGFYFLHSGVNEFFPPHHLFFRTCKQNRNRKQDHQDAIQTSPASADSPACSACRLTLLLALLCCALLFIFFSFPDRLSALPPEENPKKIKNKNKKIKKHKMKNKKNTEMSAPTKSTRSTGSVGSTDPLTTTVPTTMTATKKEKDGNSRKAGAENKKNWAEELREALGAGNSAGSAIADSEEEADIEGELGAWPFLRLFMFFSFCFTFFGSVSRPLCLVSPSLVHAPGCWVENNNIRNHVSRRTFRPCFLLKTVQVWGMLSSCRC
ncbi:hypothetical protein VTK56DRAFT_1963 [Thermocarpiscus australiensis]